MSGSMEQKMDPWPNPLWEMQPLNNQNKLDNVLLCGTQIVKAWFEFPYDLKICVFVFSWLDTRGFVYLTYFKFNPLLFISYYTEREFN